MIFVLSACNGAANDGNEIQITATVPQPEEADTPSTPDDPPVDESDDPSEDTLDDPPFMRLLKSGVYYYDYQDVHVLTGPGGHSGYVARIDDKECTYTTSESVARRQLLDATAGKEYIVNDNGKYYWINDIPDMTLIDYNDCKVTETGTEQFLEETLDYIDYIDNNYDPDENPLQMFSMTYVKPTGIRIYLKNGDVYAYRDYLFGIIQNDASYVFNPSDDPPPYCFNIPDDYKLDEGGGFGR